VALPRLAGILLFFLTPLGILSAQTTASPNLPINNTASAAIYKQSNADFVDKLLYPATVLLYAQDDSGDMNMLCTATAIEKTSTGYIFATAAHCASQDNTEEHKAVPEKSFFYISSDETHAKTFIRANIEACGYQSRGDDFCLFSVTTDKNFPIVPIGVDAVSRGGEEVVNIAGPQGLGKEVFYGRVTMPKLDRPVVINSINWTNAMLLEIPGTNGGSSGSAIVCMSQRAICGFLVGIIGGTTDVAVPVSRFKTFKAAVDGKTYKYYDADPDDPEPKKK
jgi:Trypsin-like peptidase domain